MSIVEDTERTRFCPQTDKMKPVYPPPPPPSTSLSWGYKNLQFHDDCMYCVSCTACLAAWFCPQTDKVKPVYPPSTSLSWGYKNLQFRDYCMYSVSCTVCLAAEFGCHSGTCVWFWDRRRGRFSTWYSTREEGESSSGSEFLSWLSDAMLASEIWLNIGSDNGLLPDGTKPLPGFYWGLVMPYWQARSGSTLAQIMAWCLTAPSHYLNPCWHIIKGVLWHSFDNNFTRSVYKLYH